MLQTIKKPTFQPSPNQVAIFDFVERGRGSAIVEAVAGSGKSTTIKQCVLRIPTSKCIHIFAFNVIIAKEMREAIEKLGKDTGRDMSRVRVTTFHSVGFSAICKRLNKKPDQVETDSSKVRKILQEQLSEEDYDTYGAFCAKLVGLAKGQGFGALVAADTNDWLDLIHHHDLFLDSEEASEEAAVQFARNALRRSNELAREAVLDFDDHLYIPLLWKLRLWQNDWVFIDEAQDTNPVRRAIATKALRPGGRLIAVGDRHQAIYGFTGASHDAMDLIKNAFNCAEFPLSVSYRCGRRIVELAKTLVPQIEAAPGAPEGAITHTTLKDALTRLSNRDAIMCRNTAPLIDLAFSLVAQGRGCRVLGREIGANLVNLVRRQKAKGLQNLLDKLERYREREVAKAISEGNEARAESITDRVDCIKIVAEHLPENQRTVPALIVKIEGLFGEAGEADVLSLSTMHKLKGAEFERCAIYKPELCPSKSAKQEWQLQQEYNLMYVGYTRAKLELMFVGG